MNKFNMDLDESLGIEFHDFEVDLYLNLNRSSSMEGGPQNMQNFNAEGEKKESPPLTLEDASTIKNDSTEFDPQKINGKKGKKNNSDYKKNICGYITKKIVREFIGKNFREHVTNLCMKHGCLYDELSDFYQRKVEHITGPSHIPALLIPDCKEEVEMKKVFA